MLERADELVDDVKGDHDQSGVHPGYDPSRTLD
jgi:hypothetical protein